MAEPSKYVVVGGNLYVAAEDPLGPLLVDLDMLKSTISWLAEKIGEAQSGLKSSSGVSREDAAKQLRSLASFLNKHLSETVKEKLGLIEHYAGILEGRGGQ